MVKLKSLPGYVMAVVKEEFTTALSTVATMYESELKSVDQVATDATRVEMYMMNHSTFVTAIAMGAIETELPLFILRDQYDPQGRTGYLCDKINIDPTFGSFIAYPVAEIRFSSLGIDYRRPYYEDIDGNVFQAQVLEPDARAA